MIFKCIEDIYQEKVVEDEEGNKVLFNKLVKKNHESLVCVLDLDDISGIKQSYDNRGRIHKNRCFIFHKVTGTMMIKANFFSLVKELDTLRTTNKFRGYGK